MRKSILLLFLFALLISSMASASIITYKGSALNPVSDYFDSIADSLEYTQNSNLGEEYYVYSLLSCSGAPFFNPSYVTCLMDYDTNVNIACSSCNAPITNTNTSRKYLDLTGAQSDPSRQITYVNYLNVTSELTYPSTSGSASPLPLTDPITIFTNDISGALIYMNTTHVGTAVSSIELDSVVQNNFTRADSYKNNSYVLLNGRTLYYIGVDGVLIDTFTLGSNTVIQTPTDIYAIDDSVFIVTPSTIYEYELSKYFFDGTTYYSGVQCMYDNVNNEWNICNDTQFYDDTIYLNMWCQFDVNESISDSQRCNSDCTTLTGYDNTEQVSFEYGECGIPTCQDECSFNGYQTCSSQTSYVSCGQFDSDECLELSTNIQCLSNENCQVTGDQNYGQCTDINFTSYGTTIEYPAFSLSPDTTNTAKTFYSTDSNKRTQVDTTLTGHVQEFTLQTLSVGTDLYQAKSCTYVEMTFFDDYFINTDLSQTGWNPSTYSVVTLDGKRYLYLNDTIVLTKLYSQSNVNPLISTGFIPYVDNSTNISDGIIRHGNNLGFGTYIYFTRDSTTKSISFYEANSSSNNVSLFFTDTSTNTYDDLEFVNIETRFNYEINQYDYYITLTRNGNNISYQTTPKDILNVQTYNDRTQYQMYNGTMYINYINGIEQATLPSFYLAKLGAGAVECVYGSVGCYTARIYVNGNDVPVYNNYEDNVICVNSLANQNAKQSNTGFIDSIANLSLGAKILTVILALVITFLIIVIPASLINVEHMGLFFGLAGFFMVIELILFTIIGLLPGWILFLLFILAGGIIAVVSRKTVMGA